jgi:hypothetical protein
MNRIFILAICIFIQFQTYAQQYFQQEVNYTIAVKLDDENHFLLGQEKLIYHNNSTTTLTEIYFHLWPNAYKNNETAFSRAELKRGNTKFYWATEEERGFIDSLDFNIEGKKAIFTINDSFIDIGLLKLNEPLLPGKSIVIETPFKVKIPSSKFSRFGHAKQQYQICQWYPKPAVFDQKGWHPFPYSDVGEFYSEFGSFDVSITVPKNYIVAASGDLVSAKGDLTTDDVEQAFIRERIAYTEKYLKGAPEIKDTFPESSPDIKTVRYKLDNVHDFAWFADKRYLIKQSEVKIPNGRVVKTFAFFNKKDVQYWKNATSYINDAVFNYSKWLGDYPYGVCSAVDGALSAGAGMEYPTITVVAASDDTVSLDEVIAHEVGHNWFYGILASNERDYAWMDEGSNSFYESRYMKQKYPGFNLVGSNLPKFLKRIVHLKDAAPNDLNTFAYTFTARRNTDQPLNLTSSKFSDFNYGVGVYTKTSNILQYVESWMGRERFDKMMQAYYQNWKFKHPQPEDFQKHVEDFNGRKLPWLFNDLLASRNRIDYAIKDVSKPGVASYVKVYNRSGVESPVSVTGINKDSTLTIWFDGFKGTQKLSFPVGYFDKYSVNYTGNILDINAKNDIQKTGFLGKLRKPVIKLFTGFENGRTNQLFVVPAVGYNVYNCWMPGLVFHNISPLRKKMEYTIAPLYGTKNKELAGNFQIDYFIRPIKSIFRSVEFWVSGEQFATAYLSKQQRIVIGNKYQIMHDEVSEKRKSDFVIRYIHLNNRVFSEVNKVVNTQYLEAAYIYSNLRAINPFSAKVNLQQGFDASNASQFSKLSFTFNYRLTYKGKNKGLDVRLFAGTFLQAPNANFSQDVRFRLSGQTGSQDYIFEDIFLGRNENSGVFARQFTETDGAFKVLTFRGQTTNYLTTLNLKTSLPTKIPVKLYADLGYYKNAETDNDKINYNAGAVISIANNFLEVYFPLIISKQIKNTLEFNKINFGERIRFTLNIKLLNPVKLIRTFSI